MKSVLRILHLEDNLNDAELVKETLLSHGVNCEITRVDMRKDFEAAVGPDRFDLIISDYKLPDYDGISALAHAREKCPDTPYLFVSGNIGEERAIETLKNGATDYVLKDRIMKLVASVNRAVYEARMRREHRQLEEQLRQSQKMEAIGRLTGVIAHDFNNMLTVISGYSEMLLNNLDDKQALVRGLEEIKTAAGKSSALTRQLLVFSRRQVIQPKIIDLKAAIAAASRMFRQLIGENIEYVTEISENLGRVKMDASQLEQVMLNLVVNARDAMPDGGRITVEAVNVKADESLTRRHPDAKTSDYVMFSIRDTGVGITDEVKERIFEPFFTTKEEGKGTGLGLATVFGIVHQSGGMIEVDSVVGTGAVFKIFFPRVEESIEKTETTQQPAEKPGCETVLLVEDEEAVRNLARKILERKGYKVLEAENGAKAILICKECKEKIHLLLTDSVMPQMSGEELSRQLRLLRPDMKILYVSGYMDRDMHQDAGLGPGVELLLKPFTPEVLTLKVRDLLDR